MVDIYVTVGKEGYVTQYGLAEYGVITKDPKESYLVSIPEDEVTNASQYRLVNKELVKDTTSALLVAKVAKKESLSKACTESILGRFNAKIRKKDYSFSYDKEAQQNLSERWQLFQNNMVESLVLTARDILTGEAIRLKVNKEEFALIYLSSVKHKEDNISRYHDLLLPLVEKAVSLKQIADIHWTNEMIYPNEPSIIVKDDKTLDKNIEKVEAKAEMVSQANQLNGLAMIEVANFVFANGFNKVP